MRPPLRPRLALRRALACAASLACATGCGDNLTPAGTASGDTQVTCLPDLDGRLEAGELAPVLGAAASYLASPPGETRAVDLAGKVGADGVRRWSFATLAPTDRAVALAATPLAGRWFAGTFPGATFVAPLDAAGTLLGAYSHDATGLWLHGIASAEPEPAGGKTLLPYDAPVSVLRFPLAPGAAFVAQGSIAAGTLRGLPYVGTDVYEVADDATGDVVLADVVFTGAHRVRTRVTAKPAAGAEVVTRQVGFVFECFGEIVRATAAPGEPADDFTTAAELRRLDL